MSNDTVKDSVIEAIKIADAHILKIQAENALLRKAVAQPSAFLIASDLLERAEARIRELESAVALRERNWELRADAFLKLEEERDTLREKCASLEAALEKIADPRLRDHREPDSYELGCVMHIAEQALARAKEMK